MITKETILTDKNYPLKILVVMEEGIGNMIMLTPTLKALMIIRPNAKIIVLGKKPAIEILKGLNVEAVTEINNDDTFDMIYFTMWSNKIKYYFGKHLINITRSYYEAKFDTYNYNELLLHFRFVNKLGYEGLVPETYCAFEDVSLNLKGLTVGIIDGYLNDNWKRKSWPYYRELTKYLLNKGYNVLILDDKSQKNDYDKRAIYCSGKFNIRQTAGLIKKCDIIIGNDCGPIHMAASLNIKTYAIFGNTRISKNYPSGKNVYIVSNNIECSPCQYTDAWNKCFDYKCLNLLTLNKIINIINI